MLDSAMIPAAWGRWPSLVVGPASYEALGPTVAMMGGGGPVSAVWPTANTAFFYEFSVSKPITAVKLWLINGSTASGNFDIGIYRDDGTRLVSSGSTAQAGTTVMQIVDTTDLALQPGVKYYMGLAMDGTTGTTRCLNAAGAGKFAAMGMAQMASAFPLPSTVTFALMTNAYLPYFGYSQLVTF